MEDVARGERIKDQRNALHLSQPAVVDLVNERAGEKIVGLRGYQAWEAGGGIRWEKAKVLAAVLGTDPENLMNGRRGETPDPFEESQMDRIERAIERADADREAINALLARQSNILASIERVLAAQLSAAQQMEEAAAQLRDLRERPERQGETR